MEKTRQEIQELQQQIGPAAAFVPRLKAAIGQIIVGQEELVNRLILALIADGHLLIEGLPGLAKTLAVKTLAEALGGTFSRIQFTPDLLPADVVGTSIYNPREHSFSVRLGPVFANILLADEINRAPAKVQSALLECMQEKQVTIAGERHLMPRPFLVMATQNPIEHEGTYSLPEAQVDRFLFKLNLRYPTREEEQRIVERMAHPELALQATPAASLEEIITARRWMDQVYLDDKILQYILDLVFATRPGARSQLSPRQAEAELKDLDVYIQYGVSPRASIMLSLAARAAAFMAGRAYVVPQDVKDVAPDILRHRLILTYEAEAEEITSDEIIRRLLDQLRTP